MRDPIPVFCRPTARLATLVLMGLLAGVAPARAQECVYVLGEADGELAAFAQQDLTPLGAYRLPDCAPPHCAARGVAVDGMRRRAYVARADQGAVVVFDLAAGTVAATVAVGGEPFAAALTPDGALLYLPDHAAGEVVVLDTSALAVVDRIAVDAAPNAVAIISDGSRAFVTNGDSDTVSIVAIPDGPVLDTLAVGDAPAALALSRTGGRLYVANRGDQTVSAILLGSGEPATSIPFDGDPRGLAFTTSGNRALVADGSGAAVVPITTSPPPQPGPPIAVGAEPVAVVVPASGLAAFVANRGGDSVSRIDIATLGVTTAAGPTAPIALAVGACPLAFPPTPTVTHTAPPSATPTASPTGSPPTATATAPGASPTATPTTSDAATATATATAGAVSPTATTTGDTETPTASPTGTRPTATATPSAGEPTASPTPSPTPACVGDCDGDGMVTVADLVRGVNIVLGLLPLSACPELDRDHDGTVTIADLIAAVDAALSGCAP